ncbi:integrase core domain-containing protein [Deinococcus saxicola]|uniref:integrase core domain-containing protein n=1 Tax=Deinococcus saxicola TaxID=249406 RepID=UPI0039F11A46
MGILERVNRNLKYEWIFRQEVRSITELRVQCAQFQHWYNTERLHSALGYTYPWDKLVASAKSLFAPRRDSWSTTPPTSPRPGPL